MEPTSNVARLLRALLLPVIIVIAFEAYQVGHSPPGERRQRLLALIGTVVTVLVIGMLTVRKGTKSPPDSRLSPFTLAAIAIVVIIIAVLSRHL